MTDGRPHRILFASMPADGHFFPLTGVAKHLQAQGHDVRWYAGPSYAPQLERLGIPAVQYRTAEEVRGDELNTRFPERASLKGLALIRWEFKNFIVANMGAHFDDLAQIRDDEFPFDALVCDAMFYGFALVHRILCVPTYVMNVAPMMFSSDGETPPNFVGFTPARTAVGRAVHRRMRSTMERMSLRDGMPVYHSAFTDRGLPAPDESIFDLSLGYSTRIFQSGVPGFAFPRTHLDPKVVFVGPLLGWSDPESAGSSPPIDPTRKVIVISQGTVDNTDPTKLIVPALQALQGRGHQLFVTSGGAGTEALRASHGSSDTVFEDRLDFHSLFEHTDLFISNGGYGSTLLALSRGVPVLAAGKREGKADVNAHVRHFGVGVDLRSERPKPAKIRRAAERLLTDDETRARVARLTAEFALYDPNKIIEQELFASAASTPDR